MSQPVASSMQVQSDEHYYELERLIATRVAALKSPLFLTDVAGLFELYLTNLPADRRQHYNCHTCKRFIERYGALVTVTDIGNPDREPGSLASALWAPMSDPGIFGDALGAMRLAVEHAKITGVFLHSGEPWGQQKTGEWTHLYGAPLYHNRDRYQLLTRDQAMAAEVSAFQMLRRALNETKLYTLQQAVRVLKEGTLLDAQKTLGQGEWLLALATKLGNFNKHQKANLLWLAVATSPPAFHHVRAGMLGTLLTDIEAGVSFEELSRRWGAKMAPTRYQRPQAPPDEGTIKQAEEIVAKLGSAGALARRYARLSEVTALWAPRAAPVEAGKPGGVFDHLRARKQPEPLFTSGGIITWEKFSRTVLPHVLRMEVMTPGAYARGPFYALLTAVNPEAPPILQWDGLGGQPRNPVSWYVYPKGSSAESWNLPAGAWVNVTAICKLPCHWQDLDRNAHHNEAVLFLLEGCRDKHTKQGLGLFPALLKSDYHQIRSVLEAYSHDKTPDGATEADANGIALQKQNPQAVSIKVTTPLGVIAYIIDRFD